MINIDNIKFKVNEKCPTLLRNIDIAFRISKGEKTSILAQEYQCSTATILTAYKKICRLIYWSIKDSTVIDQRIKELIYKCKNKLFICDEGSFLIEKYKNYVTEYIKTNPTTEWIETPIELKSIHKALNNKINLILDRAKRKRDNMIKIAINEFNSISRQLNDLVIDINECIKGGKND